MSKPINDEGTHDMSNDKPKTEGSIFQGVLLGFFGPIGLLICLILWKKKTWRGYGFFWLGLIAIGLIALLISLAL